MTDDTLPSASPEPTDLIFLSDHPEKIAAHLNHRKKLLESKTDGAKAPPYNFADFVAEMNMTDFNDDYQIRATLESQAHILGTAFQYLMMEGDWKNLAFTLRAQKTMRDTIALMNQYPPLTNLYAENQRREQQAQMNTETNNASMD